MKTCDLHTHSTFSDGTYTPTEIVKHAKEIGLSAVALTDHNTSKGLHEFMEAGRTYDLITVPGCEFSTEYLGKEVHVVGLFFPEHNWVEIEDYVEIMNMAKHNSNIKLIRALRKAGYDITFEEVAALTDSDEFNRAHVARALMAKGYVSSVNEAFSTLLREKHGFYVPAKKLGTIATVRFIKAYGGVAIIAHPFLNLTYEELLTFLPLAKEAGLDAIETQYSKFTEEQNMQALELTKQFDLLQSGGSDFHGTTKPDIMLGTGRGSLSVPFDFYTALAARAEEKQ